MGHVPGQGGSGVASAGDGVGSTGEEKLRVDLFSF